MGTLRRIQREQWFTLESKSLLSILWNLFRGLGKCNRGKASMIHLQEEFLSLLSRGLQHTLDLMSQGEYTMDNAHSSRSATEFQFFWHISLECTRDCFHLGNSRSRNPYTLDNHQGKSMLSYRIFSELFWGQIRRLTQLEWWWPSNIPPARQCHPLLIL